MNRQRGVALITALLIMALLAILAATLSWDNALNVRRTMAMIYHDEGAQAAYGAESWISNMLRDDFRDSDTDHLGEIWAAEFPVLPIESDSVQGALTGELIDLQGRFNVNNLLDTDGNVDQDALDQFRRLLVALDLDPRIAGVTADWLDADEDTGFPDGADALMGFGRHEDEVPSTIPNFFLVNTTPGSTGAPATVAAASLRAASDDGSSRQPPVSFSS